MESDESVSVSQIYDIILKMHFSDTNEIGQFWETEVEGFLQSCIAKWSLRRKHHST